MTERVEYDWKEDILQIGKTVDVEPVMKDVAMRKSAGAVGNGESVLVGRVPFEVVEQWLTDAGVRFDDKQAVEDIINRKLNSGEFNAFRVWEGRF